MADLDDVTGSTGVEGPDSSPIRRKSPKFALFSVPSPNLTNAGCSTSSGKIQIQIQISVKKIRQNTTVLHCLTENHFVLTKKIIK